MVIPLNADDSQLFYENIRDQYFKIITSEIIPKQKKQELYSMIGETIRNYMISKKRIPILKQFGDDLIKVEEDKLKIISVYSESYKGIQKNAEIIWDNQKILYKNLKEIKNGIDFRQNLEEKSRDELIKGNLGKS